MLPSSIPSLAKKEEALSPKVAKELARLLKVQPMVPPRPDGWRQSSAASRGVSLVRRLQARRLTLIPSLKTNKQQSATSSRRRSPSHCRLSSTDAEVPKPQQSNLLLKKTFETDPEDEHADEDVARDVCAEARRATVASRAASMVARARCDVRARGPSPGFRHRSGRETRRDAGGSRRA